MPLYGEPVFQQHGFFAGRWPVKEFGLTTMDYSKHQCPEVEAILKTGIRDDDLRGHDRGLHPGRRRRD